MKQPSQSEDSKKRKTLGSSIEIRETPQQKKQRVSSSAASSSTTQQQIQLPLSTQNDTGNDDAADVLRQLKTFGSYLQHASSRLKNDKRIVLAAVQKDGCAMQFASADLQGNKTFVLEALEVTNSADRMIEFVSGVLQDDKDIILTAVKRNSRAFKYASSRLKNDKKIVPEFLENCSNMDVLLRLVPKALQTVFKQDKDVMLMAIKKSAQMFHSASDTLQNDLGFILSAIQINVQVYGQLSDELRCNRKVALAVAKQDLSQSQSMYFTSPWNRPLFSFQPPWDDPIIVLMAVQNNRDFFSKLQFSSLRKPYTYLLQVFQHMADQGIRTFHQNLHSALQRSSLLDISFAFFESDTSASQQGVQLKEDLSSFSEEGLKALKSLVDKLLEHEMVQSTEGRVKVFKFESELCEMFEWKGSPITELQEIQQEITRRLTSSQRLGG